ncbi:MAG: hypothetical protein QXQ48_02160 [Nitrososphaerota archaeon]
MVDVLVHGSDLSAALIWYGLRREGFDAFLVHGAMRMSEGLAYLPFTSEWIKYVRGMGVGRFSEEYGVWLKTSDNIAGRFYPAIKAGVGEARGIAEEILSACEGGVEPWCRSISWRQVKDGFQYIVVSRTGKKLSGAAQILIDTSAEKMAGGGVFVHTSPSVMRDAVLDLSGRFIRLTVPHGRIETSVHVGAEERRRGVICRVTLPLRESIDLGTMPLLHAGVRSGLVRPPWLGDYFAASSLVSVKIVENWLGSGDLSENLLAYLTELKTRSELCLRVVRDVTTGVVGELELSYIFEGLRPPPTPSYRL